MDFQSVENAQTDRMSVVQPYVRWTSSPSKPTRDGQDVRRTTLRTMDFQSVENAQTDRMSVVQPYVRWTSSPSKPTRDGQDVRRTAG